MIFGNVPLFGRAGCLKSQFFAEIPNKGCLWSKELTHEAISKNSFHIHPPIAANF